MQRVLSAFCLVPILASSILFGQRTQSAKAEGLIGRENEEIAQRGAESPEQPYEKLAPAPQ